jgi:uncharacterized membrane protein
VGIQEKAHFLMETKIEQNRGVFMKKLLIILIIAVAVFACDDKPKDDTKHQTITFGANLSTTVTGHMTNSQWDNVIGKLTTALNAAANAGGDLGSYTAGFFGVGGYGVSIDLVETTEFNYYKLDAAAYKIILNADYVIDATQADLSVKIANVITSIDGNTPSQQ